MADPASFRDALTRANHTLKRALTDPRTLAGIGMFLKERNKDIIIGLADPMGAALSGSLAGRNDFDEKWSWGLSGRTRTKSRQSTHPGPAERSCGAVLRSVDTPAWHESRFRRSQEMSCWASKPADECLSGRAAGSLARRPMRSGGEQQGDE